MFSFLCISISLSLFTSIHVNTTILTHLLSVCVSVCLSVCVCVCVSAIDPFFTLQRIEFLTSRILMTISIPFHLCTTFLVALIWAESLKSVYQGFRISRLKRPFTVIAIIILGGDVTTAVLSGLYFPVNTAVVTGLFMLLAQTSIMVFFLVKGVRILRVLDSSAIGNCSVDQESEKLQLKKMTQD